MASHKWVGGSMVGPEFVWTPSDVRHFRVEGHLAVESFLTPEALSFLRERFNAVFEAKHSEVHSEWVMSLHQILPRGNWLWHLASEPKLLLWIPLDDIGPENGGLLVKPRHHVHGRLRYRHVQTDAEYEDALFNMQHSVFAVNPGMPDHEFNQNVLEYRLPAGALTMHHPSLPHCSHPNTTADRHRRVIIMRYQPASEPIVQNPLRHYSTGEEFIKCNYLMRGRMGACRTGNSRAACQLERPLSLRYELRQSPRRTRNSQPEGARPLQTSLFIADVTYNGIDDDVIGVHLHTGNSSVNGAPLVVFCGSAPLPSILVNFTVPCVQGNNQTQRYVGNLVPGVTLKEFKDLLPRQPQNAYFTIHDLSSFGLAGANGLIRQQTSSRWWRLVS